MPTFEEMQDTALANLRTQIATVSGINAVHTDVPMHVFELPAAYLYDEEPMDVEMVTSEIRAHWHVKLQVPVAGLGQGDLVENYGLARDIRARLVTALAANIQLSTTYAHIVFNPGPQVAVFEVANRKFVGVECGITIHFTAHGSVT